MANLRRIRWAGIGVAAAVWAGAVASAQTPIAHWSFDTATLTFGGGGNITGAADSTGNHNAVNTQTSGSGGGCPCTSNAIPGSNSIAGQFGQALSLTGFNTVAGGGGQFLTYPNLTELMTANSAPGAPSYSVSYWIQTTTANAHQFTVLSDWGNSATNPGRFTYGFGFNVSGGVAQMRGQSRFNTSGTGNGTDIFARPVNTAALNNGSWHMLTWTFDTTSGQLVSYFDGAQVDSFNSTAANFNMILGSSPIGAIGLKGDTGNFVNGTIALDEMWVFNGALVPAQVTNLFQTNSPPGPVVPTLLSLQVNTVTGAVNLQNTTANPIAISAYRITSSSDSLDPSGWDPIATGTPIAGFPQGNGTGNGWEVAPNASSHELVEWYLTGDSTLADGQSIGLGNAFFPTVAQLVGDYNDDGDVDSRDYVIWRKTDGTTASLPNDPVGGTIGTAQYNNWAANFGRRSGMQDLVFQYTLADGTVKTGTISYVTSAAGAAPVPEPTAAGLLGIGALAVMWAARRGESLI